MKVRVSGFQSIPHSELEISGFTVITGPSNLGKSALVRAIAGAAFGIKGTHYVRAGEDASEVYLQDPGLDIHWVKVPKKQVGLESSLEVNGTKVTAFGGDNLEHTRAVGFGTVAAGKDTLRPQVAGQHDLPFLLTLSPNAAAEVFKALGRVDVVTRAQRAAKKDHQKAGATLEIRATDVGKARDAVEALAWVPPKRTEFEDLTFWIGDVEKRVAQWRRRIEKTERLEALVPSPVPADPGHLEDPLPICLTIGRIDRLVELAPGEVPPEPGPLDPGPLEEMIATRRLVSLHMSAGAHVTAAHDNVLHAAASEEHAENALAAFQREHPTCSECGAIR